MQSHLLTMPEVLVEPRFESPTAAPTAAAAATPTATTTATPTATTSTMAAAVLRLPGRAAEIAAYGALLGQRESTVPAIFVYGHTATGKTLVVKSVLRHHNVRHAYVSCVDKYTLRLLFEAVLDQLFGHVPSQADGFTSRVRCDNLSDFVSLLVEAIDTVPAEQRSSSLPAASSGQVHQPTVHLVFDNAERLRDFSTATLLPALLRLRELTMRNICVTLISELVWDKFRAGTGAPDPYVMYFAPYSQAVSVEIIAAERPALQVPSELFQEFIKLLWNVFHGPCRDLNELRHLAQLLFPVYCEPVLQGTVESSDSVRLWRHIDPYFRKVLAKLYLREISDSEWGRVQQQAHEFAASGTSSASIGKVQRRISDRCCKVNLDSQF
ncbi:origin recognition complex [Capsaspora owczarzaki ATCC 30864]|uniref:Origin recognition complex subunit 5 n=1 Tax=Capsaspora owczarzaki (strain ATCC 30864) TaxID=595528 RepID=A0A0D2UT94_CAPO3|nr:origin recognition complex [Capsaspora owczarzaki ATCC 30864]